MSKVSILLPTRGRFKMFVDSVNSLYENCDNIEQFEILVAMDNDDTDTSKEIEAYSSDKKNIRIFYYDRQHYRGLHIYYNDLCTKSLGTSLLLWNDDALMVSKGWDTEVLKNHKEFCILSPKVDNMERYWSEQGVLFPIIPKKWVEITGELSNLPCCDSWIDVLCRKFSGKWEGHSGGLLINIDSIIIKHDRYDITGNNNDHSFKESRNQIPPTFPYNSEVLEDHYQKLFKYLNEKI